MSNTPSPSRSWHVNEEPTVVILDKHTDAREIVAGSKAEARIKELDEFWKEKGRHYVK